MPSGTYLTDTSGDIDFTSMPFDPTQYNENVDITFTLIPTVTDMHGNPVTCRWATPVTRACAITPANNEMSVSYIGDGSTGLLLDDNDNDNNTYTYKLGVMLPDFSDYFISLDPQIVNRGSSN